MADVNDNVNHLQNWPQRRKTIYNMVSGFIIKLIIIINLTARHRQNCFPGGSLGHGINTSGCQRSQTFLRARHELDELLEQRRPVIPCRWSNRSQITTLICCVFILWAPWKPVTEAVAQETQNKTSFQKSQGYWLSYSFLILSKSPSLRMLVPHSTWPVNGATSTLKMLLVHGSQLWTQLPENMATYWDILN